MTTDTAITPIWAKPQVRLIYTSGQGTSIIRFLPHDEAAIATAMARLAKRHIAARLMCGREEIGQVWRADGRWNWLFDPAYICTEGPA